MSAASLRTRCAMKWTKVSTGTGVVQLGRWRAGQYRLGDCIGFGFGFILG